MQRLLKNESSGINRQPITGIQRTPIVADDLLTKDSLQSENNLSGILEDISGYDITAQDKRIMLEDMFVRRFPSIWALKYKTIKGKPTTYISKNSPYRHRPWQIAILDDDHPNKVVEKSRQLGLSEVGMTEVVHFLINHDATKAMYIFPRNQQMTDFSKSRISPVFSQSPYFKNMLDKDTNSVSTKKILDSYLFMRSGWGGALGEGADVDFLAMDEYDRMKDGVELSFQEGLKSSQWGLMRRWSTPTIAGRGVNAIYGKSDQMRYIWTCEHCGCKQYLTFEDNVIQIKPHGVNNITQEIEDGTFIIGCKKCKKPINRWSTGEWVPMYPSIKETRGYHISQLDAAWISADDIMRRKYNYTSKQLFFNYVIGEPYASEGILINDADLRASIRLPKAAVSRTSAYTAIVAGIDWGEISYMVVLGIKGNGSVDLLNIYTVEDSPTQPLKSVSYFCAVLRAFNPNLVVADAGYGADRNAYGYTQYPASWYSCYWKTNKDSQNRTRFIDQWVENAREVTVDKTLKVQRSLYTVKNHLLGLFPWDEKIEMLCTHLKNTRIMDMEDDGLVYSVATRVGPDHTVSALTYALIGVDRITGMGVKFNTGMTYEFI